MRAVAVIVSFVLFVGGIVILGYATGLPSWQGLVFFSGIVCICTLDRDTGARAADVRLAPVPLRITRNG